MKRTFVAAIMLSAVLFGTATTTKANTTNIEILSGTTNQASIKFLASTDNYFLFDVKVSNPSGETFTLVVKDENGDVLFSKDFSDKSFNKKIKLLKGDVASTNYTFNIKSNNKDLEQSYVVNATTKVVDDVVVTKL